MTKNNNYTYKDLLFSITLYLSILLISGYFKYSILYNKLIENTNETIYSTLFLTSNIITSLVAVIFLVIIIYLVQFSIKMNKNALSKSEFLYGTTILVFTLSFFELLKFSYLIIDLENQIEGITVNTDFMDKLKTTDFAKFSNIVNYLSYFLGSIMFVLVIGLRRKRIEFGTILTGLTYLIFFSFVQYLF